jgi:hypothetical protein
MRRVIAVAVLLGAMSAAAMVGRRLERRTTVERVLGRDLVLGIPLAEVTARLRRLGVEFAADSTAEGAALVRFGREVGRDGTVTEQQLVFDAQKRLLGRRAVSQITGH